MSTHRHFWEKNVSLQINNNIKIIQLGADCEMKGYLTTGGGDLLLAEQGEQRPLSQTCVKSLQDGWGAPPVSSVCVGRAGNSRLSLCAHTDAHMNLVSSQTMLSLEEAAEKTIGLSAIRCFSPITCKSYKITHISHTHINLVTDSKYYPISITISIVFRNNLTSTKFSTVSMQPVQ